MIAKISVFFSKKRHKPLELKGIYDVSLSAERWPSGRRRSPAKGVGGLSRLEGSNPFFSAIDYKRTFICPRWHSLKSPAFAGFFAVCNWLPLYKNTPFFSNFPPIYASFLKNTVLGKAKYGAFSHGKSRAWQLTSSHQSMPVIVTQCLLILCKQKDTYNIFHYLPME